jgi:hypothetical protein
MTLHTSEKAIVPFNPQFPENKLREQHPNCFEKVLFGKMEGRGVGPIGKEISSKSGNKKAGNIHGKDFLSNLS